jgi:SurA N-terminal domain
MNSSPFAIFRRHEKKLMVALTAMAMFAFLFLDAASMSSGRLPVASGVILVAALCAGGLWFVGSSRGKGLEFAIAGAVIGGLAAFIGLRSVGPADVNIRTAIGSFTENDLRLFSQRRGVANRFVAAVGQQAGNGGASMNFFGNIDEQRMVTHKLLTHEAQQMGVSISDDAVNSFVKEISQGKVSTAALKEILRDNAITEGELFTILKDELTARQAAVLLTPPKDVPVNPIARRSFGGCRTPMQYWEDFRKLQVKQQLNLATLPVTEFMALVVEPTDTELATFFEAAKSLPPGFDGRPGFLQPRKVQLAYLSADFEQLEAKVGKPADEELLAHYEATKVKYRINQEMPEGDAGEAGGLVIPQQPATDGKPEGAATETKPGDAPDAGAAPANEAPANDAAGSTPAAPATTEPIDAKPNESAAPVEPAPKEEGDKPQSSLPARGMNPIKFVSLQTEGASEPAAGANEAAAVTEAAAPTAEPTNAASAVTDPPGAGLALPAITPGSADKAAPASKPEVRFRPFEEVKGEVEESLIREKAGQLMTMLVDKAYDQMVVLGDRYQGAADESQRAKVSTEFAATLKKFAEAEGLVYAETKLQSEIQLRTSTSDSIGSAREPNLSPGSSDRDVASEVFGSEVLYYVRKAKDEFGVKSYAYWKIQDVASKVPMLQDEGIKDEVAMAWKLEKARGLAGQRANALLELAKAAKEGDLVARLANQTVTGAPEGAPLKVTETNRFSWLTLGSNVPQQSFSNQFETRLSTVDGIAGIDVGFMKLVFETLGVGEFGTTANVSRDVFYVVEVKNRDLVGEDGKTIDEGALANLQSTFMKTELFGSFLPSPYDILAEQSMMSLMSDWGNVFQQRYGIIVEERMIDDPAE